MNGPSDVPGMRSSSIVRRAPTEVGAAALALLALCCGMADTIVALLLTLLEVVLVSLILALWVMRSA